jgi:hypothetical protein
MEGIRRAPEQMRRVVPISRKPVERIYQMFTNGGAFKRIVCSQVFSDMEASALEQKWLLFSAVDDHNAVYRGKPATNDA